MTREEEAKRALQEWVDKQGHERCWYYPEIFRRLCVILGVESKVLPALPSRTEFEDGCKKYQDEEFNKAPVWRNWQTRPY